MTAPSEVVTTRSERNDDDDDDDCPLSIDGDDVETARNAGEKVEEKEEEEEEEDPVPVPGAAIQGRKKRSRGALDVNDENIADDEW